MKTSLTKSHAVAVLESRGLSFVANVVSYQTRNPARTLKTLASLILAGHEVGTLSFQMPYEYLSVDGFALPFATVQAGFDAVVDALRLKSAAA